MQNVERWILFEPATRLTVQHGIQWIESRDVEASEESKFGIILRKKRRLGIRPNRLLLDRQFIRKRYARNGKKNQTRFQRAKSFRIYFSGRHTPSKRTSTRFLARPSQTSNPLGLFLSTRTRRTQFSASVLVPLPSTSARLADRGSPSPR